MLLLRPVKLKVWLRCKVYAGPATKLKEVFIHKHSIPQTYAANRS